MTRGSVVPTLLAFILPMIGSSLFQQLYNTVDFLYVGNFLDVTAAAAVGASSTLIFCEIGLFSGISVGTSVVVAQAMGAKDRDRAEKALHSSIAFGLIGGVLLMLIGIILARPVLNLLNTPENCMDQAVLYMRLYTVSLPFMVFYNMASGAQRAYGDSGTPFRILVICGIINVLTDALLIIVFPLGVAGVAWATVISQGFSAVLSALSLMKRDAPLRMNWSKVRIHLPVLKAVLRIGIPSGVQTVIITFSNIMVQYYINIFGETAVAAFATYYKVENFIYLPIVAFGQASTAFTGQNFGAAKYSRIRKGTVTAAGLGVMITAVTAGIILLFSETVFGWFMKDASVVDAALKIAFVSFPFYWLYPVLEVFGGAIRGMGFSLVSMFTIISCMCVLRVALLAVFSHVFSTISALAAVYPVTWGAAAVLFVVEFTVILRKNQKSNVQLMLDV